MLSTCACSALMTDVYFTLKPETWMKRLPKHNRLIVYDSRTIQGGYYMGLLYESTVLSLCKRCCFSSGSHNSPNVSNLANSIPMQEYNSSIALSYV